jgi:GNAT superfamily N-acetyltransferase
MGETHDGVVIPITPDDHDVALAMVEEEFGPGALGYVKAVTDWGISHKLTVEGEIVGVYLLSERTVTVFSKYSNENLSQYGNKHGVEGIALIVKPRFRGSGLGKKLIELPKALGYDYVFGQHLKTLNNLDHWLKRRRLVAFTDAVWVTLADLIP